MKGPLAIGGIGGSGTRLIARILFDAGLYMGGHLNESHDNLWFTLLFRRTKWLEKASEREIQKGIQLFDEAMNGKLNPTLQQRLFIFNAMAEFICRHYIKTKEWRSMPISVSRSLINSRKTSFSDYSHWGWKEPNTHLFLKPLAEFYPRLKYIHVIRHGLDMAFSKNQIQLRNFGKRFGVEYPTDISTLPVSLLEFWIRSNQEVIEKGASLLGKNFLLINLEYFCTHQEEEIKKLLDFAEVRVDEQTLNTLAALPVLPESAGRHKKKDLSIFSPEQLNAVRKLGYAINP